MDDIKVRIDYESECKILNEKLIKTRAEKEELQCMIQEITEKYKSQLASEKAEHDEIIKSWQTTILQQENELAELRVYKRFYDDGQRTQRAQLI